MSATTLDDYLSSAFNGLESGGDAAGGSESAESAPPPDDARVAAGAPPAEPPVSADADDADQDDASGTPEAGQTPAVASANASEPSASVAAPPEVDPLASAESFTYTVNGQPRTYEDIKVLKDQGAIITAEALPRLQQRLAERDHLFETSQQRYREQQELERLTAWKTTGPDGQERTLTGRDALEASRVAFGRTAAALNTLTEAIRDPQTFASLVTVNERGQIVPDAIALQHLITRAELAEVNAERAIAAQFRAPPAATPSPPSATSTAPVSIPDTFVPQYAQSLGVSGLTSEDTALLSQLAPRFIRTATADDVLANPVLRVGEPVIEPEFAALVKQQGALRTSGRATEQASKAAAQAAAKAAQENAARVAGTKTGAPTAPKATAPSGQARDESGRFTSSDDRWTYLNG